MWNQGNAGPTTPRRLPDTTWLPARLRRNQGNAGPTTPRRRVLRAEHQAPARNQGNAGPTTPRPARLACSPAKVNREPRQRGAYDAAAGRTRCNFSCAWHGTKATRGLRRRGEQFVACATIDLEEPRQRGAYDAAATTARQDRWSLPPGNQGNAGPTTPRQRGVLCAHTKLPGNQGNAGPTTPRHAGSKVAWCAADLGTKATRGLRRRGASTASARRPRSWWNQGNAGPTTPRRAA